MASEDRKPDAEAAVAETLQESAPPQPSFGPRYRVIGTLGKGGMGVVYRARDVELDRDVALKVIRADVDTDDAIARFRREIALAHKVTHPNVLRTYDLAEHRGLRFLSMELVEGTDLATLLGREPKLPLTRALSIFRQVCAGLAAAHDQGVVHRDLKPQNVLVDPDDHVRISDFGLARVLDETGVTVSGAILGSPLYMSPEQVTGEPCDQRCDIYSLGVLLYELVSGAQPFQADTARAAMAMRLHKPARRLRELVPDVPVHVDAIAARCLETEPNNRFGSVREILAALDAGEAGAKRPRRGRRRAILLAGAAGVTAGAIAIAAVAMHRDQPDAARSSAAGAPAVVAPAQPISDHRPAVLLLLGFDNRTADPVLDGTLNTIFYGSVRRSARVDPLTGVALSRLASEFAPAVAIDELPAKLAARDHERVLVVRGAIASKQAAFTISVSVTDAATSAAVFARTVNAATLDEVVPATIGLASGLREALGEHLDDAERTRTDASLVLDADHEFTIAHAMTKTGNLDGAIAHLQAAIAKDPRFALAHADLATNFWNVGRKADATAEEQKSLQYIDQVGERERLVQVGDHYARSTEQFDMASDAYEQLLAKWPDDEAVELNLAIVYSTMGKTQRGLELGQRVTRKHPLDLVARANLPWLHLRVGELDHAIAEAQRLQVDFPRRELPYPRLALALALVLDGRRAEAVAEYAALTKLEPALGTSSEADLALAEGRLADARSLLERGIAADLAQSRNDEAEFKRLMLAELRLRLGDRAGARATAALVRTRPRNILLAALVQLAAGDEASALAAAKQLAGEIAPGRRAMGQLIEAEALRVRGNPKQAIAKIRDAIALADLPFAHYLHARAELDAKAFAEAYAELQVCIARRGELVLPGDGQAGYRYVPELTYYVAKAQDGLGSPDATPSYRAFLAMLHEPDATDANIVDARRRLARPRD